MKFILEKIKSYNSTAIIQNSEEISYNTIYQEYLIKKNLLLDSSINSSSIICVKGETNLDTITLMLAIIDIGAIYVPVSSSCENFDKYIEISECTHFILSPYNNVIKTNHLIKHTELKKLCAIKDPGLIFFSSGTTGEPKASLHNLTPMLKKYNSSGKKIISISFLLYDHIGGFNTLLYNLSNAGTLILPSDRSVDTVCNLIQKYKVDVLPTTPSFLNMLLISKTYNLYDLTSLKIITYGTEPMPESTLKAINKALPNIKLKQTYGLSELGILRTKSENNISLFMKLGDDTHQIKIINDILYIKSEMSMICYLNAPSPFDKDGYFNTQDKVEIKEGNIKILGRESDIINVAGEKVYPSEIENVIIAVEGVVDVLVKGETNPILGNIVIALINTQNKNTDKLIERIKNTCKENLEKYKRPFKIIITKNNLLNKRLKKQR